MLTPFVVIGDSEALSVCERFADSLKISRRRRDVSRNAWIDTTFGCIFLQYNLSTFRLKFAASRIDLHISPNGHAKLAAPPACDSRRAVAQGPRFAATTASGGAGTNAAVAQW
ncbi:hypothetical protein [Methylocystis sp. ATCC 49242]|uniref:hypothetical protein n=1 Tax=Methylocystis sp. ATCC 49242 TaxID=622637 RepID=UPI001185FBBE|nr:hypothetical protein [Methylocystis sp. ATCC 49242]